ncbi:hypothetical protein EDB84DRAFT_112291 [Lactarius hengduanensis]|nr:hypothetical protein EDB84DRAFT_112291 [Lactarius hengduanensis]
MVDSLGQFTYHAFCYRALFPTLYLIHTSLLIDRSPRHSVLHIFLSFPFLPLPYTCTIGGLIGTYVSNFRDLFGGFALYRKDKSHTLDPRGALASL